MTPAKKSSSLPVLEKYEVLEEIGHGGMATVYRAKDRRLGREVAVKVIHRHLRESREVATRFSDEARVVAKLEHDGIVKIHDVSDDDDDERYLVAELVRGKSLRRLLDERGHLPAELAAWVGVELARALGHAHEHGIVHRDVKPENVLFGIPEDGPVRVKITDFGIAKLLDQQGVTSTGQVLGSPSYMAPEQIEGGEVDPRSDVFSLGVLLYECMVGALPFQGKNPAQVLRRVLDGAFAPPDRERATIGGAFSAIVSKMLAQATNARPSGMREVEESLSAELAALAVAEPSRELTAWVRDPEPTVKHLEELIVPKLFSRGCAEEKKGNIPAAASHFNRALAFRPGDRDILLHLTKMSRGASRSRLAKRAAVGLVALVGLSAVTFVALKSRKATTPPTAPPPPASDTVKAAPEVAVSTTITPVVASATPRTGPSGAAVMPPRGFPTALTPTTKDRLVRFSVSPKSALVSVDGGPPTPAFGTELRLSLGRHTVTGAVASENPCCSKTDVVVEIRDDGTDAAQVVTFSLPLRPATLISDGPGLAQVRCPLLNVAMGARGSVQVQMSKLEADDTCMLVDGGTVKGSKSVTLRAGKATTIVWPSGE